MPGAEGERPDSNPLGINPLGGRRETNLPGAEGERPDSNPQVLKESVQIAIR
ncbi:hypothetical protein HO934_10400 [Streptococcus suis]|nr:hypothetical protein [Streptococcus suis]